MVHNGPNLEQLTQWQGLQGMHWVAEAQRYDRMGAPFGQRIIDVVEVGAGERVLDVGCGNGALSIEAGRQVQPDGAVIGVDISEPMLSLATDRATAAELRNVTFVHADAQVHRFEPGGFDAVVSRFGMMFFDDADAAFSNVHRAMRPGGRLVFTSWQDLMHSEWLMVPGAAAAAHVGLPEGIDAGVPGPFGLADPERIMGILERAGFRDCTIEDLTLPMWIGADVEDAFQFIRSIPIVQQLLDSASPERSAAATESARAALEPFAGEDGVVTQRNGAWLVEALK